MVLIGAPQTGSVLPLSTRSGHERISFHLLPSCPSSYIFPPFVVMLLDPLFAPRRWPSPFIPPSPVSIFAASSVYDTAPPGMSKTPHGKVVFFFFPPLGFEGRFGFSFLICVFCCFCPPRTEFFHHPPAAKQLFLLPGLNDVPGVRISR